MQHCYSCADNFFAIDKAVSGINSDGTDVELMAHMSLDVTWRSSYEELVSTQSALREEARKGSVPPSYISPASGHCQYTGTQYEGACYTLTCLIVHCVCTYYCSALIGCHCLFKVQDLRFGYCVVVCR
jgi:hypothetical protein